ncbi:GPW/gp25 family protein [Ochrobactrum sp. GPK 3]
MSSSGVNRVTFRPLSGFDHVRQSIEVILTTPIGSRIMRREFGSEVFDLIDRPLTDRVILAVYAAVVLAIAKWEPRFAVTGCRIDQADETGKLVLQIFGIYYPRGHLGDFSRPEDAQTRVFFERR